MAEGRGVRACWALGAARLRPWGRARTRTAGCSRRRVQRRVEQGTVAGSCRRVEQRLWQADLFGRRSATPGVEQRRRPAAQQRRPGPHFAGAQLHHAPSKELRIDPWRRAQPSISSGGQPCPAERRVDGVKMASRVSAIGKAMNGFANRDTHELGFEALVQMRDARQLRRVTGRARRRPPRRRAAVRRGAKESVRQNLRPAFGFAVLRSHMMPTLTHPTEPSPRLSAFTAAGLNPQRPQPHLELETQRRQVRAILNLVQAVAPGGFLQG
jgi:hypothetical protein